MALKDFFNQRYQQSNNIFGTEPIDIVAKAAKLLPKNAKVIELGVGEGRNALYLARRGHSVLGIDNAAAAIENLRNSLKKENLKMETIVTDASQYRFKQKFDLIIATGLLHFLPPDVGNSLIARIKKATKDGGLNLIATLASDHPRRKMPHIYKNQELKRLYQDWEIIIYEEVAGHFHGMAINPQFQPPKVAKLLARKPAPLKP